MNQICMIIAAIFFALAALEGTLATPINKGMNFVAAGYFFVTLAIILGR